MKSRTAEMLCFTVKLDRLRFTLQGCSPEVKNAWRYGPIPTIFLNTWMTSPLGIHSLILGKDKEFLSS
jgi:hypothetical protein